MSIHSNKYDSGKIAMLKQLLENNARNGRPTEYEIKVDELKTVPRTNDPAQFDSHEDFITADTRTVTIILYEGQGKSSDKHIFSMNGQTQAEQAQPVPSLSGIDIDKKVDEKVEAVKKQMEYDKLVEENKELKEEAKEAEDYIEKLEKALEQEKKERLKIKGVHVGEIASIAAESLIRRNPHWIARVPGMEGLAGFIEEDTQKKEQATLVEESEVTFCRKNPAEELSEEEKNLLGALRELQEVFDEDELSETGELIRILMKKREALSPTLAFAQNWKEQKETQQEEKKETVKKPSPQENKTENAQTKPVDNGAKQVNTGENKNIPDTSDGENDKVGEKSASRIDARIDAELEEGIPETA